MTRQIRFKDVRKAEIVDIQSPEPPDEGEVLVRTLYTGISTGTEMQFYQGTAPFFGATLDHRLGMFVKSDEPALQYPMSYGYENVGVVEQVGKGVVGLRPGDRVASYTGHVSDFKAPEAAFTRLAEGMDPRYGVFMPLIGVAYKNILNARIILGETVVVFGAGIVGQLILQLAKKNGAGQAISVDLSDRRLEASKLSGADAVLNPRHVKDVARTVREMTDGRGADCVFEATGSSVALHEAIRTVYKGGTVYATSFYKGEAKGLYLGAEFHHNANRIVMLGCIPNEVRPRWNEQRWQEAIGKVLPELRYDHLVSHEFPVDSAQVAYDLASDTPEECMQILFDFGQGGGR